MGESTDGMAESTSKLREKIKALTNVTGKGGFDIMESDGKTFKSTFSILQGISKVWKDMNDIDQAGLLELIAGKNRAQGAAALLSNFSQAEAALASAQNATGSAMRENEKYLDSINGKLDILRASFQNLWSDSIDDSLLGNFIDLGTTILNVVEDVGMLRTALMSIGAIASIKGVGGTNYTVVPILKMPTINTSKA